MVPELTARQLARLPVATVLGVHMCPVDVFAPSIKRQSGQFTPPLIADGLKLRWQWRLLDVGRGLLRRQAPASKRGHHVRVTNGARGRPCARA